MLEYNYRTCVILAVWNNFCYTVVTGAVSISTTVENGRCSIQKNEVE